MTAIEDEEALSDLVRQVRFGSLADMRGPVPYRLGALLWALLGGLY